ncbi:hypothetical protein A3D42_00065 [Candidatus Nomurabacteria bacterium RIFCSPHIGHO2_02_FULL_41_18]|uniref:GIY-YIG domain-containing protein n=1 Tax=Candidatus Nomurabacteria bacterium RIFCSPHIGHO2_02_FULL_41_18 TaxID=1801754 RepID=A0A1F6W5V1_9BACT|nr:MAG: hypothetical protein A2737_01575 [Candidatus Nomurabacteria bacterium RIFCSPHIGHO2_01_FULL_41_71]OGI77182.1 MAG: hypothetical protein A3D42_00065 [Candidatus Nomurabacteria bacterium RIFCSPHIGHO2_02_FULL_41_18]OGI89162.1 MAG: hypothetical protein A3B01_01620 [Candidatus Nomurabacteria bacterium RIFCSPLOWO2_01_FULL_41_52b]OGJ00280.1 MAG: hypothetical protein A3I90_01005 [Candidatus Nomurabacteria bacterium RIFCSPLOWO2_02_FULL_41_9]
MYNLSQSTIEKLEYYVYLLSDPRTDKVFYVGKGYGNRINQHLLGALEEKTKETKKVKTIREIQSAELEVGLIVLRHGLTEKEALEIESAVIDFMGKENLTNLVLGHHSFERGKMSLADIKIEYEAEDAIFNEPVLLLNIKDQFYLGISSDELYKITMGNWGVSLASVSNIKIICAVAFGIIREVYIPKTWSFSGKLNKKGNKLYYFDGKVASQKIREKYLNKSVSKFKKRSQNSIKYVG